MAETENTASTDASSQALPYLDMEGNDLLDELHQVFYRLRVLLPSQRRPAGENNNKTLVIIIKTSSKTMRQL